MCAIDVILIQLVDIRMERSTIEAPQAIIQWPVMPTRRPGLPPATLRGLISRQPSDRKQELRHSTTDNIVSSLNCKKYC